jgi:hypothetical protein
MEQILQVLKDIEDHRMPPKSAYWYHQVIRELVGVSKPPQWNSVKPRIKQALDAGRKIWAIKTYRDAFGCGLREAKFAVEYLMDRPYAKWDRSITFRGRLRSLGTRKGPSRDKLTEIVEVGKPKKIRQPKTRLRNRPAPKSKKRKVKA